MLGFIIKGLNRTLKLIFQQLLIKSYFSKIMLYIFKIRSREQRKMGTVKKICLDSIEYENI